MPDGRARNGGGVPVGRGCVWMRRNSRDLGVRMCSGRAASHETASFREDGYMCSRLQEETIKKHLIQSMKRCFTVSLHQQDQTDALRVCPKHAFAHSLWEETGSRTGVVEGKGEEGLPVGLPSGGKR